jgi:uncharacterized membrane protein
MELLALLIAALVLVFPIYVLIRLSDLGARVQQLTRDIEALRRQAAPRAEPPAPEPAKTQLGEVAQRRAVTTPPPAPRPAAPPPPPPQPAAPPPAPSLPRVPQPSPAPAPVAFDIGPAVRAPQPPPAVPPPAPPRAPARPSFSLDLEELVGANWPAKLGIAAIAIAAAFFLKYAIDQGWIVPAARVAIGLAAAGAFYGLGQWLLTRPKYRRYAQALASGGVVIFFLTIWAAYNLYGLISFSLAYGILAAAALAASALAVRNDTQAIGVLCLLGAYATPVLIRQGGASGGDLLRLYAYLLGVDLWAVLLVRFRPWYSLLALAFAATWVVFFGAGHLQEANAWSIEGFAALFLLFSVYSALKGMQMEPESEHAEGGLAVLLLGLLAFAVASAVVLAGSFLIGVPALAIVGAATALALAALPAALRGETEVLRAARHLACLLVSIVLGLMVIATVAGAPPVPAAEAPAAFAFGLCSYLLFLAAAAHMSGRPQGVPAAALLVAVNAVTHLVLVYHALPALRAFELSFGPLWLPVAGWLTVLALPFAPTGKPSLRPALLLTAQAMLVAALLGATALLPGLASPGTALGVFGAEFLLISLTWTALRREMAAEPGADVAGAITTAAILFTIFSVVAKLSAYHGLVILCGCALGLAAYHALVGGLALRGAEDRPLRLTFLGLALTFVTIAVPLQLRATALTVTWAAESAVLVWGGLAAKERRLRWSGLALLTITAVKAIGLDLVGSPAPAHLLLNARLLSGLSVALAAVLAGYLMGREREHLTEGERAAPLSAVLSGVCFALIYVSVDLWQYLGWAASPADRLALQQLALTALWSAAAVVMLLAAPRLAAVRALALVLLSGCALKALLDLTNASAPAGLFTHLPALSGLIVAASAAAAGYLLWRVRDALGAGERSLPVTAVLSGVCLALIFMSVDLWQYLGATVAYPATIGTQQLALTLLWSTAAVLLIYAGTRAHSLPTWMLGLVVLGAAAAKIALADLTIAPEPFGLFANARFLGGAAVVLAAYLAAWALPKTEGLVTEARPGLLLVANLLTLIVVSLDLWDYFGRVWQGPEHGSAQQLALSIFWSLYALVVLSVGIWRRLRAVRLFAMGLLYLSIAKVFLLDLSFLATPYRIVSFLGLGVILLLVSLMYTRFEEWLRAGA